MDIISRSEWGARPPRSRLVTTWAQRTEFVVHHTEGPIDQTVRSIQNFHMDDPDHGWSDIGYNFLVDDQGRIYEGRGWLVIGAQAHSHNTSGIGVAYIGQNKPSVAAKASIRALYDYACSKAGRTLLKRGHGQLSGNSTDCPGSVLLAWVKSGMPAETPPAPSGGTVPPWPGRVLANRRPEMHGNDVLAWQRQMRARGWTVTADGYYGPACEALARAFQREKELVIDGEVGEETWTASWAAPVT